MADESPIRCADCLEAEVPSLGEVCGECATQAEADRATLAREVAEFGVAEQRRAEVLAVAWAEWAANLERLIAAMPAATGLWPRYMDDIGDRCDVHVGAEHIEVPLLRARVARAVADADALSGAWRRAAGRVEERTDVSLTEIRGGGSDG